MGSNFEDFSPNKGIVVTEEGKKKDGGGVSYATEGHISLHDYGSLRDSDVDIINKHKERVRDLNKKLRDKRMANSFSLPKLKGIPNLKADMSAMHHDQSQPKLENSLFK